MTNPSVGASITPINSSAGSPPMTLSDANIALEALASDLSDASALLFELAGSRSDFEFNRTSLRAVAQLLESLEKKSLEDAGRLHSAWIAQSGDHS